MRIPAPSGQEMDGNAGILSRVELQRLIYFGIRPSKYIKLELFFGLLFILCSLSLQLYLLLPCPVVTCCRIPFGGCAGLGLRCLPGMCRISVGRWRHLQGVGRSGSDERECFLLGEDFRTCSIISRPSFSHPALGPMEGQQCWQARRPPAIL